MNIKLGNPGTIVVDLENKFTVSPTSRPMCK